MKKYLLLFVTSLFASFSMELLSEPTEEYLTLCGLLSKSTDSYRASDIFKTEKVEFKGGVHQVIVKGSNNAYFLASGLKQGDIIISINHVVLDSTQSIRDIYKALKGKDKMDISLLRGAQVMEISIPIARSSCVVSVK